MVPASSSLHLLSIDFGSAPSRLRAVLELRGDDVEHWIRRARMAGAPLAIVCGRESIDLYSSDAGRRIAFKPLLRSWWALGRHLEGFERIRTREVFGYAVVEHLLGQAAELGSTEQGRSYAGCIRDAGARAARFGTLSDALDQLFELATTLSSSHPPSRSSYAADEPDTGVRLRVRPFQSLFPLSTRKSG